MFNNSTKRHSFRKMATDKKYIPLKKTEMFINGNYSLGENPRFLIWQPF